MHRRAFLGIGAAAIARAQVQAPPMPPPPKAKITSSVMLWTLEGSFERKVLTAAEAGLQNVGLRDEYTRWDDAALLRAKRYMESFGLVGETLLANPGTNAASLVNPAEREACLEAVRRAIIAAKKLETPYLIVVSGKQLPTASREAQYASLLEGVKQAGALAETANLTLLMQPLNKLEYEGAFLSSSAEALKLIKEADNPNVRLMFDVYGEQTQGGNLLTALRDALDYTSLVTVADAPGRAEPGTGSIDFTEVYQTIQKSGYSRTVAMEYKPRGSAIASLKRAADKFRAGVKERATPGANPPASPEGSFV